MPARFIATIVYLAASARNFKNNSLNKGVDIYELLRIAIYNDCRVVPLCGTDDDNRATYFATFIQQEQERGV